nr:hypothetical protein [uncultured Mucilaginibacter sp.]
MLEANAFVNASPVNSMDKALTTFRTFDDLALAEDLANTLKQSNIPYELKTTAPKIDVTTMTSAALAYDVMVYRDDFERVNKLLEDSALNDIEKIEKDYYLFAFTDEELLELVKKADEWSAFDVMLAQRILNDRGSDVSDRKIKEIHSNRIEELRQPEPPQTFWIVLGYILALMGGIFGIFVGRFLYSHKKTLPNGEMVFAYRENDRRHGRNIFYIATVCFAIGLLLKLRDFF